MISQASGSTCFRPSGMKKPSSRSRPRSALIARGCGRPASPSADGAACAMTCWVTVLMGTGRICSLRKASSSPSTSVRSVLFLIT